MKAGLDRPDSDYCTLIRNRLYGTQACLEMDALKRDEAAQRGEIVVYKCHAGLVEVVKPIYFQKHLLGFVMIGQFRSEETIPNKSAVDWYNLTGNDDLKTAFDRLPLIPQERIDHIIALFSALVDSMVLQRMVVLQGDQALEEIIYYMESNPKENLTLAEAAKLISKSPSTVSHLFSQKLGQSFKQTAIEIKLEKAEEYMSTQADISVAEAARMVGYDDPMYFSRIYKRHRGFTPIQFIRQRTKR